MRPSKHVHTFKDGRGARDVFLNGNKLDRVMYADTKRGIVRCVHDPIRLDKRRKRVLTFTLRGKVEVPLQDWQKRLYD